jgi:hypothetical protein
VNAKPSIDPADAILGTPKPDWDEWRPSTHARLWEAAALACNISPRYVEHKGPLAWLDTFGQPSSLAKLLDLARSSIAAGGILRVKVKQGAALEEAEVTLANFAAWLNQAKHLPPAEFPWVAESPDFTRLDWPWGRHSTTLLRKLAEAADRFWRHYDPDDPTTAPTNKEVIGWLTRQGVASRTAEVMATLLRADGLPTGPRK